MIEVLLFFNKFLMLILIDFIAEFSVFEL
jgi:hypothetical protein